MEPELAASRRTALRAVGAGVVASFGSAGVVGARDSDSSDPVVTVEDQSITGSEIIVSEVTTDVQASLFIFNEARETIGGSGVRLSPGESLEDRRIGLSIPISMSQRIEVALYESNGPRIASDSAYITVEDSGSVIDVDTDDPIVGEEITFDAGQAHVTGDTIHTYDWSIGDEVESGETVTHTFEEAGEHSVELTVVTEEGVIADARTTVTVDEESSGDSLPGFTVPSVVAGLGGGAYLLRRRSRTDGD